MTSKKRGLFLPQGKTRSAGARKRPSATIPERGRAPAFLLSETEKKNADKARHQVEGGKISSFEKAEGGNCSNYRRYGEERQSNHVMGRPIPDGPMRKKRALRERSISWIGKNQKHRSTFSIR